MAHFARLDENNFVIETIVVRNNIINDLPFPESEPLGIDFCQSLYKNEETVWKQTSYNGNFRWRYAQVGFFYDSVNDGFVPPTPYPSWVIDPSVQNWVAPIAYPTDGDVYSWDEATVSWVPKPKPYPSWVPNSTCRGWMAPIPMPEPNYPPIYKWDEPSLSWVEAPQS